MTTLCFNSIERDQWSSFGCSPEDQKVKDVRNQILHYGVDQKYLFRLEDVTKKMNTPKVVRCLEEVAKLVSIQCRQKFRLYSLYIFLYNPRFSVSLNRDCTVLAI